MTQQQLADAIGVHYVTMSKIERAKADVSFDQILRLSDVLDIAPAHLLFSGPFKSVINFAGSVKDGGYLLASDKIGEVSMISHEHPFESKMHEWYDIETNDFFPILHEGDRIRTQIVNSNDDNIYCYDRICIFESLLEPHQRILAVAGYGRTFEQPAPKAVNGRPLDFPPARLRSIMTMVLPMPFGSMLIEKDDQKISPEAK